MSLLSVFLSSVTVVAVLASKLYSDHEFLTCVSEYGSNASGCSVSGSCCSSFSKLVVDLNKNCQVVRKFSKIVVELKSDLGLNDTIHFGNFCGNSLALEIKGNHSFINCFISDLGIRKDTGPGLYFNTIRNLSISDLTFLNCGSLQSSTSHNVSNTVNLTTYLFPTTLYLLNCSNVKFVNTVICNGRGIGAALFDTVGDVRFINCVFESNKVRNSHYPGGGGLYIEFTNCTPGYFGNCHRDKFSASYTIDSCSFTNNNASLLSVNKTSYIRSTSYFQGMGKGGGMAVYINGNSSHYSIRILNCTFLNNSAVFGGGLFVQYRDSPSDNSVVIENSNFTRNKCYIYGGGGACGGFIIGLANSMVTTNNTINFTNCVFERNSAKGNGGGLSLFSSKGMNSNVVTNKIHLVNCIWRNNSAFVASAFDLAAEVFSRLGSGLLPIPVMDNCSFEFNYNQNSFSELKNESYFNAHVNGLATVYISGFQVEFRRSMFFLHNNGTGLYLSLASVNVTKGSTLHFEGNNGKHGGAITMTAFSVLFIHDNCVLSFVNNTSVSKGGVFLVHSIDSQHEAHFSHSCFIQYQGRSTSNITARNITFKFINNKAMSEVGHILFATSLLPCTQDGGQLFEDIGTVTNITNNTKDIASLASRFNISPIGLDQMQELIPGTEIVMDISAFDELHHKQDVVYEAFIIPPSNITIDRAYSQVSNNTIKFHGNSSGNMGLLALEAESASLTIHIRLSECPPGLLNDGKSCVCSKLEGIAKCENINSFIVRGFWIGRCSGNKVCTARCPPGYCSYNGNKSELLQLPPSLNDLDGFLCDKFRTGILCNECKNGSAVYYHSHHYRCQPNNLCSLGILFYLLSEILPLTIVFLVVTIFNISLTSGAVNGFVLFAQISDSIDISARGSIEFPRPANALSHPYRLIYRMFNFDFFSLESLSFCLWESATALDLMAVKYVTITFALFLVLLTVVILNSWKCKILCAWFRPRTLRAALTHGLTTLLIICFSQCARVCFLILSPTELTYTNHSETVVSFNGGLHPFHKGHIQYAIPALFFLFCLVFLPLVWLLLYPLLFKMLAKCHLSESRISHFSSKIFPIELLDSFQSCFKDNCRHFAGLYFLYRIVPLIVSIVKSHFTFYTLTSVQFLGMLTLHSAFQPYKNHYHNLTDSFIFANLLLVNLLTAYNYGMISGEDQFSNEIKQRVVYVQLVLMYLPLVYILCICATKVYKKGKQKYLGYFKIGEGLEDSTSLPQLRNVTDCSHSNN